MDCYRIEWQGPYPSETAEKQATVEFGVYMECVGKNAKTVQYVGRSKDLPRRLREHRLAITRHAEKSRLFVFLGSIYPFEGSRYSSDKLKDVESFLMNTLKAQGKLKGNDPQTTKQFRNKAMLLINTGKMGPLDKIMCHDERLLALLKKNLPTTKRKRSSDAFMI